MHALVKLVCDRCYVIYRRDLEAEGWTCELAGFDPAEGICSMCGKVEGHRTIQLRAPDLAQEPEDDPHDSG
jgi:hypothetical protein